MQLGSKVRQFPLYGLVVLAVGSMLGVGVAAPALAGGAPAGGTVAGCAPVAPAAATALAALPKRAPSPEAAARVLARIQQRYVNHNDPKQVAALDAALQKAQSAADGTAGALYLMSYLNASIYAFSRAAQLEPDTSLVWANLGAALNDAGRYADAAAALRYALALEPKNAIAQSNLAILYGRLGDGKTAIALLNKSLDTLSGQLEANLALAQLYACRNKPALALQAARTAYAIKPTERGRKIVKKTANDAGKSEAWVDYQGLGSQATGGIADNPSGPGPEIPLPQHPDSVAAYIGWTEKTWPPRQARMIHEMSRLAARSDSVGMGNIREPSGIVDDEGLTGWQLSQRDHPRTTFYFSYIPQQEHFNNLEYVYQDKIQTYGEEVSFVDVAAVTERFGVELKREHDALDRTATAALAAAANAPPDEFAAAFCAVAMPANESLYAAFRQAYKVEFNTVEPLITEYYRRTNTLLGQFPNPDDVRALDLARQSRTMDFEASLYMDARGFSPLGPECYSATSGQGNKGKNSMPDAKVKKCHSRLGINVGLFEIIADCEKLHISGGEGLIGTLDWDYRQHKGTVYLGTGLSLAGQVTVGSKTIGPNIGAQMGVSVTFDDSGLIDGGLYEQTQATISSRSMTDGKVAGGVNVAGKATLTIANGLQTTGHGNFEVWGHF